ncbi:pitrilysin family protein [Aurantimonas sp. C2-6-R+9]|uniref:M16 family metallopeptidase n=1 Tax=unclassified Aurantimonas TaxID=2638230 RepID=UPI002E17BEB4|nr:MULTISPECIES: pitrilysin family protein [unclassified Aurantimonas]MEC5288992.1 pitrilysin family protein [Aurantimonas sp. C2-3-R2]MEC5379433.1 pitrilysin family protein [Aurantimonas sp. C2-6-R+9]MEC5410186.1 pitrilysin family protein [Aurantimonas sp. C2-4-R8]
MKLFSRQIGLSALAVAFALPLAARAETVAAPKAEAATQQATAKEKAAELSTFMLDNGLQVVVLPDHRAPVVTQMLYYKVGAADEAPGESGIAHFFEHLMFKGTKTNSEGTFSRAVAEIGGQENAFTTSDYTGYYQQVPADALEMVMTFEADRMENLVLSKETVAPERDVILEERRSRVDNDPGSQLAEAVQAALFQNSPYGDPVIGWRSEIEALSRDGAVAFYDKYYTPNNAILLIAGDVTEAEVRRLAEATYGKVARRAEPGERVRPVEPEPLAARTVTLTDARVTQPSMQRAYLVPSDTTADPGEAEALDVLADVLGGGTTSRLYRGLVVDKAIAAGAGAHYAGTALEEGQFVVYGMPRGEASLEEIEAAIDAEIARIVEKGITAEELERAKNRVRKDVIYLRDSQTSMARRYAAALSTGRTIADVEGWPERIEAVTVEDVAAAARKYLQPKRSVTGYLLPEPSAETRS